MTALLRVLPSAFLFALLAAVAVVAVQVATETAYGLVGLL